MITLTDVRDFVKKQCNVKTAYVGRLDASKENVVGVYNTKSWLPKHKPISSGDKIYYEKQYSLLVHGSKSKPDTEKFANSIYNALDKDKPEEINKNKIIDLQLLYDAPIDVDYSENQIYEYVIEFKLIVEV